MNKPLECLKSEYSHEKPWQGKHCCIKTEEEDFVHDYGNIQKLTEKECLKFSAFGPHIFWNL